jgi:uncharacterized repeat protein (TIGR03803 family)
LFELSRAGQIRVVRQLVGPRNVLAKLVPLNGVLYGAGADGGTNHTGAAFGIDHSTGRFTMRYSFPPFSTSNSGNRPEGSLLYYNGYLYGMTNAGGQNYMGVIYKIEPATGNETDLYNFQGVSAGDGKWPMGGFIQLNGVLYGMTTWGGDTSTDGDGTIFKFDPSSATETVLYRFKGGSDGSGPLANLTAVNGVLYGTAVSSGVGINGSVFKINPSTRKFTLLYDFQGGADGSEPCSTLYYLNGKLWGTTMLGGRGYGTVFTFDPKTGLETTVYRFAGGTDATQACGDLTQINGVLYGTSQIGGTNGRGTVYQVNATTGAERVLYNF